VVGDPGWADQVHYRRTGIIRRAEGIPCPGSVSNVLRDGDCRFILLGQIRYTIEGLPTFIADQGDIVYVPKQRWHLASLAGNGMSARLAMNGYTDLAHSFEAPDTSEASR
jgi:hypothetical protein